MRKILGTLLIASALMTGVASMASAANPATITVTVTIQNLSVSASGAIAFGTVVAGTQSVSTSASTVVNDGNVTETYSLSLTNPGSWTAKQAAPGAEEYALNAEFNTATPTGASFSYANHALSTVSIASSGTKFAGDQTGLSVPVSGSRSLWFRFDAPSSTAVTSQQTISVTLTASAG